MYRNYKLNELRMENIGEEVILSGWVSKVRDLGHFVFIDLRDRYGITQILINEEASGSELLEEVKKYKNKTCQIKNLKLSELLEMIERLENMIINRTRLMEEHIKDYIVKRYNMD